MNPESTTVFVVDDDPGVRKSISWLLEGEALQVRAYASPTELLSDLTPHDRGCIISDFRMPEMNGLELQTAIRANGIRLPLIVITGFADVETCRRAFHAGALDFLEKPVSNEQLLSRVQEAIALDRSVDTDSRDHQRVESLLTKLTPREREVMDRLVKGKSMKQIAVEFGVSIQTASKHRIRILEKLEVANDIELVRLIIGSQIQA